MQLKIENDQEELALLRRIVRGMIECSGRETTGDSYELDYCWDLAEDYAKWVHIGNASYN